MDGKGGFLQGAPKVLLFSAGGGGNLKERLTCQLGERGVLLSKHSKQCNMHSKSIERCPMDILLHAHVQHVG